MVTPFLKAANICLHLYTETVVEMTKSVSTGREKALFRRVSSVNVCTLCDEEHKDVVQRSGELELVAITLKGGNYERKGTVYHMSGGEKYIHSSTPLRYLLTRLFPLYPTTFKREISLCITFIWQLLQNQYFRS